MVGAFAAHDGLPGQSKAEIAPGSGHDAEPADHIMVDLASAAIDLIIDGGEIMLHVDPLAYDLWSGEQHFQQTIARIFTIIVRMQEDTPAQVQSFRQFSPPNQKRRIV